MLVILQPDDIPEGKKGEVNDEEKWVIMTVQPRVAAGSMEFVELPAGMVDDGTFGGAAAREIWEEVGLKIEESELVNLSELAGQGKKGEGKEGEGLPNAMFPSAGGCDEFIPLFMCEKKVKRDELDSWTGRLTGLRDEGEKVSIFLSQIFCD